MDASIRARTWDYKPVIIPLHRFPLNSGLCQGYGGGGGRNSFVILMPSIVLHWEAEQRARDGKQRKRKEPRLLVKDWVDGTWSCFVKNRCQSKDAERCPTFFPAGLMPEHCKRRFTANTCKMDVYAHIYIFVLQGGSSLNSKRFWLPKDWKWKHWNDNRQEKMVCRCWPTLITCCIEHDAAC